MKRADVALVEGGLAPSRTRAQEMIASGRVRVAGKLIAKSSHLVALTDVLTVDPSADVEFVSRGGLKLRGALERTDLDVSGLRALDVGISTGGFTDCLLKRGAASVLGIDVGHRQLAAVLAADPRVTLIEGVNARDLSGVPALGQARDSFDLVVIDVSFISLSLVLPQSIQYLKRLAPVVALVKPQFEVGRQGLGKNGVVKDPSQYVTVEAKIRALCTQLELRVEDYFASSIEGSDGNKEFFVLARRA